MNLKRRRWADISGAKEILEEWFLRQGIKSAVVGEFGRGVYFKTPRRQRCRLFTPRWLVQWVKNPYPELEYWRGIEGSYEILCEEEMKFHRSLVDDCTKIIENFRVKAGSHHPRGGTRDLEKLKEWVESVKVRVECV